METVEQNETRLATDRWYRRQRLADLQVKKRKEEKDAHLVSCCQHQAQSIADKRAKENEEEKGERLRVKGAKEVSP
jgi:hypothetical protein